MTDRELKLIVGSLLHDIGKMIYRSGDGRQHSISGAEYLQKEAGIGDKDILDMVRYHHGRELAQASLDKTSLAYVTYIADNIAAASDRREDGTDKGFDPTIPLDSIFNILNGNDKKMHYKPIVLDDRTGPNMPTADPISYDSGFYSKIKAEISTALQGVETLDDEYVNSLLCVLEAYLSYLPSSTSLREKPDISLYDHMKMTAAYASCILQYLEEKGLDDYHDILFDHSKEFYEEKAFRLISMDISGIQKFIYTIHSEGALRMLRARSFYLEILMEHMIDELLSEIGLSRANLLYSGGGHCYILAGNTEATKAAIEKKEKEFNEFFLSEFGVALYVAMASASCSANDLENQSQDGYSQIFYRLSDRLSTKKSSRYNAEQIRYLNKKKQGDSLRECKVCKTSSRVNAEGMCSFCQSLHNLSGSILYKNFFSVFTESKNTSVALPGSRFLAGQTEEELRASMKENEFVRTYGKNRFFTGKSMSTRLWVGDYTAGGKTTEEYAKEAEGIDRIAVLRADVDNLGAAFVSGFEGKYRTLSRTATFSRQLSLFFKLYINHILENGEYDKISGKKGKRNATIVYSGGDDLFIVGSWDDVISLAVDVRRKLKEYSENTLTISGGIGMYPAKYPLSVTADQVAELEENSKKYKSQGVIVKNALTLFDKENSYSWDVFENKVVGEKLEMLKGFLDSSDERGKAFLYRLLELLRNMGDRINLARFAYLLARLEPKDNKEKQEQYRSFSQTVYRWAQDETDKKQLITAIYLYVYLNRVEEGQNETAE